MKNWEIKEKDDAKTIKGKRVRGSGNQWYAPADSKSDVFLVESKYTSKKSYSLNINKLDKLYEEALFSYRIPIFSIQIQDQEFVVLWKEDFEKLIEKPVELDRKTK